MRLGRWGALANIVGLVYAVIASSRGYEPGVSGLGLRYVVLHILVPCASKALLSWAYSRILSCRENFVNHMRHVQHMH